MLYTTVAAWRTYCHSQSVDTERFHIVMRYHTLLCEESTPPLQSTLHSTPHTSSTTRCLLRSLSAAAHCHRSAPICVIAHHRFVLVVSLLALPVLHVSCAPSPPSTAMSVPSWAQSQFSQLRGGFDITRRFWQRYGMREGLRRLVQTKESTGHANNQTASTLPAARHTALTALHCTRLTRRIPARSTVPST